MITRSLVEKAELLRARREGFLRLRGHEARRRRLRRAWFLETRRRGLPFVTLERHDRALQLSRVRVELHPRQELPPQLWDDLRRLGGAVDWTRQGHVLEAWDVPHRAAGRLAAAVAARLHLTREGGSLPRWEEGLAVCVWSDGVEGDLGLGQIVYVREIPGSGGLCVAWRHRRPPLVGLDRGRFRMLRRDEVPAEMEKLT